MKTPPPARRARRVLSVVRCWAPAIDVEAGGKIVCRRRRARGDVRVLLLCSLPAPRA